MDNVEQRFLAAIRANPDDREARDVYADWLEERGDPRGEYLRLEAQLHSIPRRLAVLRPTIDREWIAQVERRFDVVLVDAGPHKIGVIKVVREVANIGLRDAKDLVEAVRPGEPRIVCSDRDYEAANRISYSFKGTGATVHVAVHGNPVSKGGVTVTLTELDAESKVLAIIAVREVTGLGLKQAKDLVEIVLAGTPATLLTGVDARRGAEVEKRFATLGRILCSPT